MENDPIEGNSTAVVEVKTAEVATVEPMPVEATEPIKSAEAVEEPLEPGQNIVVFARNPREMKTAQDRLVLWADGKIKAQRKEYRELKQNYEIARKNKWRSDLLKRHTEKALRKCEFYEKVKGALEEGYCIVPEMPIDVFAVRTTRKNPKQNFVSGQWSNPKNQVSNRPPSGEGRYVSSVADVFESKFVKKHEPGKQPEMGFNRWAETFRDVDFPFTLAKPEILEATARAMQSKVFDEFGILPARRTKGDPMIIGRVSYKDGYNTKSLSFVVAWFIDTKDL